MSSRLYIIRKTWHDAYDPIQGIFDNSTDTLECVKRLASERIKDGEMYADDANIAKGLKAIQIDVCKVGLDRTKREESEQGYCVLSYGISFNTLKQLKTLLEAMEKEEDAAA
jgi:hypothetical protein